MAVLGVTVLFTALAAVLLQLDFLFLLIRFFFYEKMNSHFFHWILFDLRGTVLVSTKFYYVLQQ